jgi:hypothetical protein
VVGQVEFHGTAEEANDLVNALARFCSCGFGLMGVRLTTCPGHSALIADQRWLDGLVFEKRRCAIHFPGAGMRVIRPTEAS